MLSTGYKLSAKDTQKLKEFKKSSAYGTYLKAITNSPIFVAIVNEHIKNVDITDDVTRLQNEGEISSEISADALSQLFKASIRRMAINVAADTILLKEIEDKNIDDVLNDVRTDCDIVYILGLADEKYYKEAQRLLEQGKIDEDDVAFLGLMNWLKRQDNLPKRKSAKLDLPTSGPSSSSPRRTSGKTVQREKRKGIDPDALDIEL